jgi:hypothetical protein
MDKVKRYGATTQIYHRDKIEKELLKKKAKKAGLSVSEYLRELWK